MINIVLFGAPGCGKGTQAQRLKAHYGIEHVSTGEVIRDEIRRGTELGRSMESYIKAGKLAPDQIVIGMIANYVAEHKHAKGCIFRRFSPHHGSGRGVRQNPRRTRSSGRHHD